MTDDIIYPIGKGELSGEITQERRVEWIKDLEDTPGLLKKAVEELSDEQLDTPYRDGGWTIRQIVHHLTDSNINSYVRFKLAVTEDKPTIKTWEQSDWAVLKDATSMPVDVSLGLLNGLHQRWVVFLNSLTEDEMKKTFVHPEGGVVSVEENIWNYSWHSRHHTAQITATRERKGW